jgi:hypothetical protein
MASLYRTLLRAGFDPGVIRRELATVGRSPQSDAPDVVPGDEGQ